MKEIRSILKAFGDAAAENMPTALAMVVSVEGSAYRRAGARMLLTADGRRFGSLSGGCLEADVAARARRVMETGAAETARYDPRKGSGDLVVETGCRGAIEILIERGDSAGVVTDLECLGAVAASRLPGLLATVVEAAAGSGVAPGDRLACLEGSMPHGALSTSDLAPEIVRRGGAMVDGDAPAMFASRDCRILLERRLPPIALLLCGSGHDTPPVAEFASALGWQVSVADPNGEALSPDRYPGADRLLAIRPGALAAHLVIDSRTAVVLMTHNFALDADWLRATIASRAGYLGILGPRARWQRIAADLDQEGLCNTDTRLRVHSPAGLDIGSETPQEIALAIVAEIQAVISRRHGGPLTHRAAFGAGIDRTVRANGKQASPEGEPCPKSES